MAKLKGKTLFFITSPRTPLKMVPEIQILIQNLSGKDWNTKTQEEFIKKLASSPDFEGQGCPKDMAFSARDRINRGPKALGFVDLDPKIQLTDAGKLFLDNNLCEEALLRQLLKFQLPSPYHTETNAVRGIFFIKPYLEIFRLIYELETVTFDELMIFGMQLTDYRKFDEIVNKILKFRVAKNNNHGSYKEFMCNYRDQELHNIYEEEIGKGKTKTRESKDASIQNFIKTKASNIRDYTDACFRYLRATGMISISQKGRSLSISPDKKEDVKFFLSNVDRTPCLINNEVEYKKYLFDSTLPVLYTDNRENLISELKKYDAISDYSIAETVDLKKKLHIAVEQNKTDILNKHIERIKAYKEYSDILNVYGDISKNNYYDTPLMFEWNTWRAMTMIDGGNIMANLKFDDNGQPMNTAGGKMPDIVCDYGDFYLTVEVTMQSGMRQYESESEPVSRHLAKVKKSSNKDAYCFFIAPKINESCIAHFYMLHKTNIEYYGGESVIIPLELEVFEKMVEQSGKANKTPSPEDIRRLCNMSMDIAKRTNSEKEWYNAIKNKALNWLTA